MSSPISMKFKLSFVESSISKCSNLIIKVPVIEAVETPKKKKTLG